MKKVYIVMARTGEYSSRTEWPVHAHMDESAANAEVVALVDRAKALQVHTSQEGDLAGYEERDRLEAEFGHIDYTGIDWCVMPVEFADEPETKV